jgi:hypothetical protein
LAVPGALVAKMKATKPPKATKPQPDPMAAVVVKEVARGAADP